MDNQTHFFKNDGGRAAAGFKGDARDCVIRAVAIATNKPYADVYREITLLSDKFTRTGVPKTVTRKYILSLGWKWTPTMAIGLGCKVHLTASELPSGRIIASVSRHIVAVIDGVVHDTYNSGRGGKRCVYGYYSRHGA